MKSLIAFLTATLITLSSLAIAAAPNNVSSTTGGTKFIGTNHHYLTVALVEKATAKRGSTTPKR